MLDQEPGTVIHKDCAQPMKVEVFTHNSPPGEEVTAIHYTCETCGETWTD